MYLWKQILQYFAYNWDELTHSKCDLFLECFFKIAVRFRTKIINLLVQREGKNFTIYSYI